MLMPFMRPSFEVARRFKGKIAWNGLLIEKCETLHSMSFKTSNWIEMKGFEMLCGDFSYKITYTLTKGQGVMGKRITKGTDYVKTGALITPIKRVKFMTSKRLEPNTWYTINVVICIHEYDMNLITSQGSGGISTVETDCGVVVQYQPGLESCSKTNSSTGQLVGILFSRVHPDDERFYTQERLRRRSSASTNSIQDSAVGSDIGDLELPSPLRRPTAKEEDVPSSSNIEPTPISSNLPDIASEYPVSPPVVPTTIEHVRPALIRSSSVNKAQETPAPASLQQSTPMLFQQPTMFHETLKSQAFLQPPSTIQQRPVLISANTRAGSFGSGVMQADPPMRTEDILKQYMNPYNRQ